MGISPIDEENKDVNILNSRNLELLDFDQWNVAANYKNSTVILAFRKVRGRFAAKIFGYMMSGDNAIKMGEALISTGLQIKDMERLSKK